MSKKLYKVDLRASGGMYYVVAESPDKAYQIIKEDLEKRKIGFSKDRELLKVTLLAEDVVYPDCEVRLYTPQDRDSGIEITACPAYS